MIGARCNPGVMVKALPPRRDGPPLHEALRAAFAATDGTLPAVRESHGAWVVLAGERAYKLRKPVRFAFLDYSTPAARRAACEEELRVNAPLAADIMLGVRGLRRTVDGVALCDADADEAVDWVVVMRRFDERRTMAALLERGALTADLVHAAAARLASFHGSAEIVDDPDPAGRVQATMARNVDELCAAAGEDPDGPLGALGTFLLGATRARRADLDTRARALLVRDGHGDLRAEHVVFEDAGVLVVDRIEFDPALRRIDVADDLSFLMMDLEARGARDMARLLVTAYRDAGGDPGDAALLALFAAHRALVRAKVALLRERQQPQAAAATDAAAFLALAARLAWRARGPLALIVGGPPASGKSTLATALAARSGLPVLSSDRARKVALGLPRAAPAPSAAYSPQARSAVYRELGLRAREALDAGDGVIVDATFGDPQLRAAFLAELTPAQRDAAVLAVECRAPADVLVARAAERPQGAGGSDAGPDVAERLARSFRPITELAPQQTRVIDAVLPTERQVAAIEEWVASPERRP